MASFFDDMIAEKEDPRTYLATLSAHRNRPGDTSNLHPGFASNLAAALREARAAGLNLSLASAYRDPGELAKQGGHSSAGYDASGLSLHSYGGAGDIQGLDGPGGKITRQWADIAARHNLYNPYGIDHETEFNHWQALPKPIEQYGADVIKAFREAGTGPKGWTQLDALLGSTPSEVPAPVADKVPAPGGFFDDFMASRPKSPEAPPILAPPAPLAVGGGVKTYSPVEMKQVMADLKAMSDREEGKKLGWGAGLTAANTALFGMGTQLASGIKGAYDYVTGGSADHAKEVAAATNDVATAARKGYEDNPDNYWPTVGAKTLGGMVPVAMTMSGIGAGLEGLGAAGAPTLARFLGGTYGAGITNPVAKAAATWGSRAASGAIQGLASDYATSSPGEEHPGMSAGLGAGANLLFGPIAGRLAQAAVNPNVKDVAKNYWNRIGTDLGEDPLLFGHQVTTDKALAKAGAGAVGEEAKQGQLRQFTRSVARTFGGDQELAAAGAEGLTPSIMTAARNRIGDAFNLIASRTQIPFSGNISLQSGFNSLLRDARDGLVDPQEAAKVGRAVALVISKARNNGGIIDGDIYQKLTKGAESVYAQLMQNNNTKPFARRFKNLLDNELERYAPQDLKGAIGATRQQFRNLEIADDALGTTQHGLIDPKLYGKEAAKAADTFGPNSRAVQDLADAGNSVKFPSPDTQGATKGAAPASGFSRLLGHGGSAAGGAGLAIAGEKALEHAPQVFGHLSGAPLLAGGGLAAAGLAAGVGGLAAARSAAARRAYADPRWAQRLLFGASPFVPNSGIPLAVQAIQPWEKQDEAAAR